MARVSGWVYNIVRACQVDSGIVMWVGVSHPKRPLSRRLVTNDAGLQKYTEHYD